MLAFTIRAGVPDGAEAQAARLYWQSFGPKLGCVLGPEARAMAFLARALRPDRCLAAVDAQGRVLGLAGFRTAEGGFAGGTEGDLAAVYGRAGGLWRGLLLGQLGREDGAQRFVMDGLCVAAEARGQGVGAALVEAICAEAARRGHAEVRLDVVDTNPRARALYERLGFRAVRTSGIGPLRLIFGFAATTTMVRPVA